MDVENTDQARTQMRDIELVCDQELDGSTLLRDLHILVCNLLIIFMNCLGIKFFLLEISFGTFR